MTISPEAKEAARVMSGHFHFDEEFHPDSWERTVQLAINSAINNLICIHHPDKDRIKYKSCPVCVTLENERLQKEIERLRGEVEKAHAEGWMHRDKYNYRDHDTIYKAYSRAKRMAEGTDSPQTDIKQK